MKKVLHLLFFLVLGLPFEGGATHNRAGEITYEWLGGTRYRATITTYTKESVTADRCQLELFWGDGESSMLPRVNGNSGNPCGNNGLGVSLGNDIQINRYVGEHNYAASSGNYILYFEDPNRNAGIKNIIQSVNVPFYVQSELFIAPSLGGNNSPSLLKAPIDDGCINQVFKHNPGAFDIDGDSLSYKLVLCRTTGGQEITTIYDPLYVQDEIVIDARTGDMIWDVPRNVGQYNFAIRVDEFRKDVNGDYTRIGYVTRDLQVDILTCNNRPPVIQPVGPFCVEAGKTLNFDVTATDPDNDRILLSAYGGPFTVSNPAVFNALASRPPAVGTFRWVTACNNVRKQPYFVTFEAKDIPSQPGEDPLVDLFTAEIRVVAPAPENPTASTNNDFISLRWDESICKQAIGYRLYRREDSYGFVPAECETGVPAYTGYEFLAEIPGLSSTTFEDNFNLKRGVRYCYMVIAFFEDESESYASVEFCTALPLSLPLMTNANVLTTEETTGEVEVQWLSPPILDSANFPPPYGYVLYRATGIDGSNFSEIQTFSGLKDTFYLDSGLNTRDSAYTYKVDFLFGPNGDKAGTSDPGSTIFLEPVPFDEGVQLNFNHNTPWFNFQYEVYRETSPGSGNFVLIDTAFGDNYRDSGLVNGDTYCYKVQGYGRYTASPALPMPYLNFSQEVCAIPIDTMAPCAPLISADYNCIEDSLFLSWQTPRDPKCKNDVVEYRIYYKPGADDTFPATPILTLNASDSTFLITRSNDGPPISGCYAVTAVDDADLDQGGQANESLLSEIICAEACPLIDFPNVFTPNADGDNDFFTAISAKDIKELRISVHNRWGTEVYQTNDANQFLSMGWDGTDSNTGGMCADGVYFYICRYTPISINGAREREATGFVHLFRNAN